MSASYFNNVISVAAVTRSVEGADSVSPNSAEAANFIEEILRLVQIFSENSEVFFEFDWLAHVHVESPEKRFSPVARWNTSGYSFLRRENCFRPAPSPSRQTHPATTSMLCPRSYSSLFSPICIGFSLDGNYVVSLIGAAIFVCLTR